MRVPGFQAGIGLNHRRREERKGKISLLSFLFFPPPFFSFFIILKPMTDKVVGDDVAGATHSSPVETQQPPAPTREDGTLRTIDDGELNPPTGATSSTTISPDQLAQLLGAVNGLASEGMHEQAMKLMESLLSTGNNDGSTIMTPPPSQANSGARGVRVGIEPTKPAFRTCRGLRPAPLKVSPETLSPHRWW